MATKKPAKKTVAKAVKAKKATKPVAKVAAKPAKKAVATVVKKPATLKKGGSLSCVVCGLIVTVDEVCGCTETHEIICCSTPMKPKK